MLNGNVVEYFNQRMQRLSVTPELNQWFIKSVENTAAGQKIESTLQQKQFFSPFTEDTWKDLYPDQLVTTERERIKNFLIGGIYIPFYRLDTRQELYTEPDQKYAKYFYRVRLRPEVQTEDQKYYQPGKSGVHIYLTPSIIEKYQKGEKIETLHMVEGEFKAFKGWMHGLDIIGMGGKDGFHLKNEKSLHPTILEILRVCKPDNFNLILDADTHLINWEKWKNDPNYDLGKRLLSFYTTVKDFREQAKNVGPNDIYFTHINNELSNADAKGLDDLLEGEFRRTAVLDDLSKLSRAKDYFTSFNLLAENPTAWRKYFLLDTNRLRAPVSFFNKYQKDLQVTEFTFNGFRFKYNNEKEELEITKHNDSDYFIRVGCNFMKLIYKLKSNGDLKRELKEWKSGEISRDYVKKGYPNFFDTIEKFDDFENDPCNLPDKYRPWIQTPHGRLYNLYYPLEYLATEGDWSHTKKYLEHIFGTRKLIDCFPREVVLAALGGDESKVDIVTELDLGLDYETNIYLTPKQRLPILALYSKERNTGKSTMIDWKREIYGNNATSLGNEDLEDKYNDDFAGKKIVGVEETFIEKEEAQEKIKNWCTNPQINMHGKFKGRTPINNYITIIITSNKKNFIKLENEEVRFWIRHIQPIENYDPDFLKKMTEEIPAYLHYLQQRPMMFPDIDRLFFHPPILRTEAHQLVVESSRSYANKVVSRLLKDLFLEFDVIEYEITLKLIRELINDKFAGIRLNDNQIQQVMEEELGMKMEKHHSFHFYQVKPAVGPDQKTTFYVDEINTWTDGKRLSGTPYKICIEKFLKEEDYTDGMKLKIAAIKEASKQTSITNDDGTPW